MYLNRAKMYITHYVDTYMMYHFLTVATRQPNTTALVFRKSFFNVVVHSEIGV